MLLRSHIVTRKSYSSPGYAADILAPLIFNLNSKDRDMIKRMDVGAGTSLGRTIGLELLPVGLELHTWTPHLYGRSVTSPLVLLAIILAQLTPLERNYCGHPHRWRKDSKSACGRTDVPINARGVSN